MGLLALAAAATVSLSPQAEALIAPVHAAYVRVEAEEARLPPARSDRQRLERMLALDQAGREAEARIDLSVLPPPERQSAEQAIWREIEAHDLGDQAALKPMIAKLPAGGWFTKAAFGDKASEAAFLIVQHAVNDPALMRDTLARVEPLARRGEIDGGQFALMYDRVAQRFDHKPQRYGTQLSCKDGQWQALGLEDPDRVDARRKALGLEQSEAEYLKAAASDAACH
jgi:hypothetical protein